MWFSATLVWNKERGKITIIQTGYVYAASVSHGRVHVGLQGLTDNHSSPLSGCPPYITLPLHIHGMLPAAIHSDSSMYKLGQPHSASQDAGTDEHFLELATFCASMAQLKSQHEPQCRGGKWTVIVRLQMWGSMWPENLDSEAWGALNKA